MGTRTRVLKKGKVDVHSIWSCCSQLEDVSHLLFLPVDVIAGAKLDTTDLGIGYGVLQSIEMLSNGETERFFLTASEMFPEAFSECATGLPDVESRAATTRDAVGQAAGMTTEMFLDVDRNIRCVRTFWHYFSLLIKVSDSL